MSKVKVEAATFIIPRIMDFPWLVPVVVLLRPEEGARRGRFIAPNETKNKEGSSLQCQSIVHIIEYNSEYYFSKSISSPFMVFLGFSFSMEQICDFWFGHIQIILTNLGFKIQSSGLVTWPELWPLTHLTWDVSLHWNMTEDKARAWPPFLNTNYRRSEVEDSLTVTISAPLWLLTSPRPADPVLNIRWRTSRACVSLQGETQWEHSSSTHPAPDRQRRAWISY